MLIVLLDNVSSRDERRAGISIVTVCYVFRVEVDYVIRKERKRKKLYDKGREIS